MSCCSRIVFQCFKSIERFADRLTGAAGPFFVASAWILITAGVIVFFEIIAPTLSYPLITIPLCILLTINLFAHYYYVLATSPGFVDEPTIPAARGWTWAKKANSDAVTYWSDRLSPPKYNQCKRCGIQRPERAHHCRICKRCILKYDHHCPVRARHIFLSFRCLSVLMFLSMFGINQCVGLHNERHFVLFMSYLIMCSFCFVIMGLPTFWQATRFYEPWPYWTPSPVFMLLFILSAVIGLALLIMCAWHIWSAAKGETSVEGHDFEAYRGVAKARGDVFVNAFDLGYRKNLALFFNIGPGRYPVYTLLLPLRLPPYTDGRSWVKREGMERHHGVGENEEYTDEE